LPRKSSKTNPFPFEGEGEDGGESCPVDIYTPTHALPLTGEGIIFLLIFCSEIIE